VNEFSIEAINFVLGERSISIRDEFPHFAKVIEKTGIETVHETSTSALNLAAAAVTKLLAQNPALKDSAGALIYVTQSPTSFLPRARYKLWLVSLLLYWPLILDKVAQDLFKH
jgi:3-oxoacyl-[acyl-carrier-protein] synthase III